MITERVLAVAKAIEKSSVQDLGFNMCDVVCVSGSDRGDADRSGHDCGTVACVAGWTLAVMDGVKTGSELLDRRGGLASSISGRMRQAGAWLGLSEDVSGELFYGFGCDLAMEDIGPGRAVLTLRYLAATGRVDWNR